MFFAPDGATRGKAADITTRRRERADQRGGCILQHTAYLAVHTHIQEGCAVERLSQPTRTTGGQRTAPPTRRTRHAVARLVPRSACMCVSTRRPMGSRARLERSSNQFEAEAWEEGRDSPERTVHHGVASACGTLHAHHLVEPRLQRGSRCRAHLGAQLGRRIQGYICIR